MPRVYRLNVSFGSCKIQVINCDSIHFALTGIITLIGQTIRFSGLPGVIPTTGQGRTCIWVPHFIDSRLSSSFGCRCNPIFCLFKGRSNNMGHDEKDHERGRRLEGVISWDADDGCWCRTIRWHQLRCIRVLQKRHHPPWQEQCWTEAELWCSCWYVSVPIPMSFWIYYLPLQVPSRRP